MNRAHTEQHSPNSHCTVFDWGAESLHWCW